MVVPVEAQREAILWYVALKNQPMPFKSELNLPDLSESLQSEELTHEFTWSINVELLQIQSPQVVSVQLPSSCGEHDDFIMCQ